MTASASAIVGTSRGCANETASIRRAPASTSRVISSTLASVERIVPSFWSPSRGLTSTIVTSLSTQTLWIALAELEGVAGLAGELHPHGLDLGVLVEGVGAVLPAEPALAEAAERRVGAEHAVGVDPDRARVQLGGHAVRPLHVARPHRARQPVRGVVGELQRLL